MMRRWPRNAQNDPFFAASHEVAAELTRSTGLPVGVGFNEFCAPSVDEALDRAVSAGARNVCVVTTMLTPGGGHAEVDIPAAIERARQRHRNVRFAYLWPFGAGEIAAFLAARLKRHLGAEDGQGR